MVFEAGLKKWREQQRREAEHRTMEQAEYATRVIRANLVPMPASEYKGATPVTVRSWLLHRELLIAEGLLDERAEAAIKLGIEAGEWRILHDQISCEVKRLQIEIEEGKASDFLVWLDQQGVPREFAHKHVCMPLLTLESIRRLGLDHDPRFKSESRRANEVVEAVLRERALAESFSNYISGSAPKVEAPVDPASQCEQTPEGFVKIKLSIPNAALKTDRIDWSTIRYHPEFGLVVGLVGHYSYIDRGAGAYPVARGARVHEYSADVRLLLSFIKGWKTSPPLSRESVWTVSHQNEAVIGRWSENETVRSSLSYRKIYDSEEGVKAFLRGTTKSAFWRSTLPVSVFYKRDGDTHELDFKARPISLSQLAGPQP